MSTPQMAAYKARLDEIAKVRAARQRRQRQQKAAMERLGCEYCLCSKDDIRTEQARLRHEFYERQQLRDAA